MLSVVPSLLIALAVHSASGGVNSCKFSSHADMPHSRSLAKSADRIERAISKKYMELPKDMTLVAVFKDVAQRIPTISASLHRHKSDCRRLNASVHTASLAAAMVKPLVGHKEYSATRSLHRARNLALHENLNEDNNLGDDPYQYRIKLDDLVESYFDAYETVPKAIFLSDLVPDDRVMNSERICDNLLTALQPQLLNPYATPFHPRESSDLAADSGHELELAILQKQLEQTTGERNERDNECKQLKQQLEEIRERNNTLEVELTNMKERFDKERIRNSSDQQPPGLSKREEMQKQIIEMLQKSNKAFSEETAKTGITISKLQEENSAMKAASQLQEQEIQKEIKETMKATKQVVLQTVSSQAERSICELTYAVSGITTGGDKLEEETKPSTVNLAPIASKKVHSQATRPFNDHDQEAEWERPKKPKRPKNKKKKTLFDVADCNRKLAEPSQGDCPTTLDAGSDDNDAHPEELHDSDLEVLREARLDLSKYAQHRHAGTSRLDANPPSKHAESKNSLVHAQSDMSWIDASASSLLSASASSSSSALPPLSPLRTLHTQHLEGGHLCDPTTTWPTKSKNNG